MEQFAEYGHAIASVAGVAMIALVLSPFVALGKIGKGLAAGSTPEQDYTDKTYRLHRAYGNLTEMMGVFAAVVAAAILAGASPFWVNLLASVFLVTRLITAFVHIQGIGPENRGPRSIFYVLGWACCLVLAVLAIVAVF